MKVLFVIPKLKSRSGRKSLTISPHIGIASLCSFLKQNGIEVKVYDEGIDDNYDELVSVICMFNPDMIGISILSYCYNYARDLIKTIKNICNIPIVLGGAHVNISRSQILAETGGEFAIKHEGEYTLLELLKTMESGDCNFGSIRGLIWRDLDGKIRENIDRPFIQDLNSLPFPDYSSFDMKKYFSYTEHALPMITSRGCPFGCNFCSVRLCMGRGFRSRSAENVVAEIEERTKNGWQKFLIEDDCFNLDIKRAEKICDLIIEKNIHIAFQAVIRADRVTTPLIKKMKLAGCFYVSFGCESGNEEILKTINKSITLEQVRGAVKLMNEVGIPNSVNFMIGHTKETFRTAMDTINFAKSLPTNFANFYNFIPYPGTEAFDWVLKYGTFLVPLEQYVENISCYHDEPIFETSDFTRYERKEVLKKGFKLYKLKFLQYKLGRILGYIIFTITNFEFMDKLASSFVLDTRFGKLIYLLLCNLKNRFRII